MIPVVFTMNTQLYAYPLSETLYKGIKTQEKHVVEGKCIHYMFKIALVTTDVDFFA